MPKALRIAVSNSPFKVGIARRGQVTFGALAALHGISKMAENLGLQILRLELFLTHGPHQIEPITRSGHGHVEALLEV
jgi:hypothetical protein